MNELDWIAEELTDLEERVEARGELAKYAAGLRRALQRAFVEACKASRVMRCEKAAEIERRLASVKVRAARPTAHAA